MNQSEILLEVGTNELEILEFYIDETNSSGENERVHFGINVAKVMQVIENPDLVPSDYAQHPAFLGVISLREHILPIVDLGTWLGMNRTTKDFDLIMAMEFSQEVIGFLVSGVTEIHRIGWEQVKPPGAYLAKSTNAAIIGTVERDDRFILLLDVESILSELNPADSLNAAFSKVQAREPYPVLVADDSPTILGMIIKNLKAAGFAPFTASDGQLAWEKLCQLRQRAEQDGSDIYELVRLVISDIEMPMLDGFTLTKRIKADSTLGKIPVILYSSIITPELRHKGEFVKADDQVSKPELQEMAGRALNLIEGAAETAGRGHAQI